MCKSDWRDYDVMTCVSQVKYNDDVCHKLTFWQSGILSGDIEGVALSLILSYNSSRLELLVLNHIAFRLV